MGADEDDVQQGTLTSDEEMFFLKKHWEMKANSPDRLDELAKSFITTIGMLTTVYFGVVTFSKIKEMAPWFRVIAVIPIILWLLAVISALIGLLPGKYRVLKDVPESAEKFMGDVARYKFRCVKTCGWLIFAGLAVLMVALVLYVGK